MIGNIRDNGNEDISARTNSEVLLTFMGKSETTGEINPYTILLTTNEPMSYSSDNFSTGNYDINYVKSSGGQNVCTTILDEVDSEQEFNFNIQDDFVFVTDNHGGFFRNILLALLKGQSIKVNNDTITMVGTNGTEMTGTRAGFGQFNLPYKRLFDKEATKLKMKSGVLHGMPTFKNNSIINSFSRITKTVMIEIKTTSGQGIENTSYIPYLKINGVTYDEGDINSYSIEATRLCDIWERKLFLTEGSEVRAEEYNPDKDNEFEVDTIGYMRPIVASEGEILCLIADNGCMVIEEYLNGEWGTYFKVGMVVQNTRIFGTKFVDRGGVKHNQNCFAVSEKGDLSEIIELTFSRNEDLPDTKIIQSSIANIRAVCINGLNQYIFTVNHFNRDTKKFEPYTTFDY